MQGADSFGMHFGRKAGAKMTTMVQACRNICWKPLFPQPPALFRMCFGWGSDLVWKRLGHSSHVARSRLRRGSVFSDVVHNSLAELKGKRFPAQTYAKLCSFAQTHGILLRVLCSFLFTWASQDRDGHINSYDIGRVSLGSQPQLNLMHIPLFMLMLI